MMGAVEKIQPIVSYAEQPKPIQEEMTMLSFLTNSSRIGKENKDALVSQFNTEGTREEGLATIRKTVEEDITGQLKGIDAILGTEELEIVFAPYDQYTGKLYPVPLAIAIVGRKTSQQFIDGARTYYLFSTEEDQLVFEKGHFDLHTELRQAAIQRDENIARAKALYEKAEAAKESAIPTASRYLIALAEAEFTPPHDTYTLAQLMKDYPSLEVKVLEGEGGRPRLVPEIIDDLQRQVDTWNKLSPAFAGVEKILANKVDEVVDEMAAASTQGPQGVDDLVFKSLARMSGGVSQSTQELGRSFWEKEVPNRLTGKRLEAIAYKRNPSLRTGSPIPQ